MGLSATAAAAAPTVTTAASAPHLVGTNDTGSIAWMLVSTALVFFMMPGLALFYGGMVRAKNVLNMFMLVIRHSERQPRWRRQTQRR